MTQSKVTAMRAMAAIDGKSDPGRSRPDYIAPDNLEEACQQALARGLTAVEPNTQWCSDYPFHVRRLEENLYPGSSAAAERIYLVSAGQEVRKRGHAGALPAKMQSVRSSAALVFNTFSPWLAYPAALPLFGVDGFESLRFEVKCPTGLGGTPPHLDLVLMERDGSVLGVESKCLEYLHGHRQHFSKSYDQLGPLRGSDPFYRLIGDIGSGRVAFHHLDAAQLIKHALGLIHCYGHTRVRLCYLFWEPLNWQEFAPFHEHRREVGRFGERVAGSQVQFFWATYADVISHWRCSATADTKHLAWLETRYCVRLQRSGSRRSEAPAPV